MGSVQVKAKVIWVRCLFDQEMEYECFTKDELKEMILDGLTNYQISGRIGAEHNQELENAINDLRNQ